MADPPWLRLGRRGSIAFIAIGCVALVFWQLQAIEQADGLDRTYRRTVGRGLYEQRIQKYFYFQYYTGKFPITTTRPIGKMQWNADEAWRAIGNPEGRDLPPRTTNRRGVVRKSPRLIMEDYAVLQTGDLGKIFLLYPDAWVNGTPKRATLRSFNRGLGIASLLALFVSFALLNYRLLGTTLVILLGSHPQQLLELYWRANIFGYPIALASLMLALHAGLIFARPKSRAVYLLPVVSGVFLVSFREVRLEPALAILSVAGTYLFAAGGWRRRSLLIGLLVVCAATTSALWSRYWDAQFHEAYRIVERQGGETFDGDWNAHHAFWHSIWCGLGDFGKSKGYLMDDRTAYRWGIPRVNLRFGTDYRLRDRAYVLHNYHTAARKHHVKPETLELYSVVMRDKVLGDIRQDPLWYAGVLLKRLGRVFSNPTPVRLGIGAHHADVPFSAWLFLPAIGWLAFLRRWDPLKLLAFYLPTSLSAVAVWSGGSMTYNSAFHLVLFALVVCWIAHASSTAISGYTARRRPHPGARGASEQ